MHNATGVSRGPHGRSMSSGGNPSPLAAAGLFPRQVLSQPPSFSIFLFVKMKSPEDLIRGHAGGPRGGTV